MAGQAVVGEWGRRGQSSESRAPLNARLQRVPCIGNREAHSGCQQVLLSPTPRSHHAGSSFHVSTPRQPGHVRRPENTLTKLPRSRVNTTSSPPWSTASCRRPWWPPPWRRPGPWWTSPSLWPAGASSRHLSAGALLGCRAPLAIRSSSLGHQQVKLLLRKRQLTNCKNLPRHLSYV